MSFFCLHQSRHAKKGYEKVQKGPRGKPLRRIICRIGDSIKQNTEPGNDSVSAQQDMNPPAGQGDSSDQHKPALAACCCCCQNRTSVDKSNQKTPSKGKVTVEELEDTFPRFGPAYKKDPDSFEEAKKEAWSHVLNKTDSDEEESRISGIYLSAIKEIEKEAKDTYDPPIVAGLKKSQFQWMMIIDGCFFLQLALYVLGGSKLLGYPKNHVYFGSNSNDRENNRWIKAMFFVGNQVPYVVIRKLMKQSFFQDVIERGIAQGTWYPPSDNLPKLVLYLLLIVLPKSEENGIGSSSGWLFSKLLRQEKLPHFRESPTDLLHGMHCLVLGPGDDPLDCETEDPLDLEAGIEEFDKNDRFPSAAELEQKGIKLKTAKHGIREIQFHKKLHLFGRLYVPPFTFNSNTEPMLRYLRSYETEQKLGKSNREVAAYLRFMGDLIQTQRDVKVLESAGIIEVKKQSHKDKLPGILSRLGSSEEITFTQNLRLTRLKVTDYTSPPWHLLSLALVFTVVQTVFTVLSYFVPFRKNN